MLLLKNYCIRIAAVDKASIYKDVLISDTTIICALSTTTLLL